MKKMPAVFLDRDGVLTVEKSYITKLEDLEIFPYAKECITKIHNAGYLAIVITNQSAIGRGMLSEDTLMEMNDYLQLELGVDFIYYCPHWHDKEADPSEYNKICDCRKPRIGMLEKAAKMFPIEMRKSFFVGDRISDILTGKKMEMTTILLESGYSTEGIEVAADYQYKDLEEFVNKRLPIGKS